MQRIIKVVFVMACGVAVFLVGQASVERRWADDSTGSVTHSGILTAERTNAANSTRQRAPTLANAKSGAAASSTVRDDLVALATIANADPTQLTQLARDAAASADSSTRRQSLRRIFDRLAELAPVDAFELAGTFERAFDRHTARAAVIQSLAATDADAALALAADAPNDDGRAALLEIALRAMVLDSPAGALAASDRLAPKSERWRAAVFSEWARVDAVAAMAYADSLSGLNAAESARQNALRGWLESDAQGALVWFEQRLESGRIDEMSRLAGVVAAQFPAQAQQMASRLQDPARRNQILMSTIETLAGSDPALAAEQIEQLQGRQQEFAITQLSRSWAEVDPTGALAWAGELPANRRDLATREILARWVGSDVEAALAYVDDNVSMVSDTARDAVISGLSLTDPERALEWMLQPDAGPPSLGNAMTLAMTWGQRDPVAAITAFANYENESWGQAAVATSLALLAQMDATAAQDWFERLDSAQARARSAVGVATGISTSDPDAALAWARTLAPELRDHALLGVTRGLYGQPQTQYDIAVSISDPQLRTEALEYAIYAAAGQDTALAQSWLTTADVSEEFRQKIRRRLGL